MARRTASQKANQIQAMPPGPLDIPYRFGHRHYQAGLLAAMMPAAEPPHRPARDRGVFVGHRGCGKDMTSLAGILIPHMIFNPGTYWHVFPKFTQGKKAIWQPQENMTYTDLFPPHLVTRKNDTECLIEMESRVIDEVTGEPKLSVYQVVGGDTLSEHLVGAGPRGIVYSEWPIMDKSAFDFIEPRLLQNGGWALFCYTPRGKNHGWDVLKEARRNPRQWFHAVWPASLTRKDGPGEDGGPVISAEDIDRMRSRGMVEEIIQQEMECSFDGYSRGTIFGDCLARARADQRIVRLPREVNFPVACYLDIGRSDGTAIWFAQILNREIRLIDYLAFRANKIQDQSAAEYAIRRIREKPYLVTRIVLPNDAQVKGYSAARSTFDLFADAFQDVVLLEKVPVQAGIEMVRSAFPRMVFDESRCSMEQEDKLPSGLDSLGNYHRTWDDDKQDYSGEPVHDQFSHGADALRYGAMDGFQAPDYATVGEVAPPKVEMTFNPRAMFSGPVPLRGW